MKKYELNQLTIQKQVIFEKKQTNREGIKFEDINFPGVLKKQQVDTPEINYKQRGIFRMTIKNFMWNFLGSGSWLQALKCPRCVTKFC